MFTWKRRAVAWGFAPLASSFVMAAVVNPPASAQDIPPSFEFTVPVQVVEVRREISGLRIACSVFGDDGQQLATNYKDRRLSGRRFRGNIKVPVTLPDTHEQADATRYRCQMRFLYRGKEVLPTNTVPGAINSARARTPYTVLVEGKI